ncbi:MAG: alpha-ketoacid dehydrogenase subunit beta [Thermoanaerobaculia bacterium]|nr:alpha-ketoacid dehydrogenase subunit beta [Thermoanaerobaculia bacterium]
MADSLQAARLLSVAEAIREGLERALDEIPEAFVMGEGVTDPKGIFGTTTGLMDRFGKERVIETPISENAFTGIAVGACLLGQRPIIVHQRVEFMLLAMEQLINNAAKLRYLTRGRQSVPMVIRLVIGRGWGQGPQHAQSLESVFAAIPGLKVAMPSRAVDARDMLMTGIRGGDPLVLLEHRWLHGVRGPVADDVDPDVLSGPVVRREGEDLTLVATSYMVLEALRAADALAAVGITAEVIDLRVLRPLELAPIGESVRRTGRLVVIDTGHRTLGMGAEVVATISERQLSHLKAPPRRLGLPDRPAASARSLAASFYPRAEEIAREAAEALGMDTEDRLHVERILDERREHRLVDVPDPSFQGPF